MSKINIQPQRNEIRRGEDAGYKRSKGKYIWQACEICNKERWVEIKRGQPVSKRCHSCAIKQSNVRRLGSAHPHWKGGRMMVDGYVYIRLYPDDFFYPMATRNGYVAEHRLVMAKHLKRRLLPWEVVHHKPPGIRDDNRLEKLELIVDKRWHMVDMKVKKYIKTLENKIKKLEAKLNVSD